MTVLILAQEADAPVDAVVTELTRRGVPVFRCDTSWFPQHLTFDAELVDGRWRGTLSTVHRSVGLDDVRSVWYRDPTAFRFPPGLTDVERAFAHREARLGLGGVLSTLDVTWVNHPNRAADAMYKPLQLATAAACGLTVPRTMITNSSEVCRRFIGDHPEEVVQKSLGPNTLAEGDELKVAYTRRLEAADMGQLDGVSTTCTQLQGWVDKLADARLVVVGDRMFLFRILPKEAGAVDCRAVACDYELVDTPAGMASGVTAYMKTLGLSYAALDFAIDRTGDHVFLESNGNGQYLWLEHYTDTPITDAIADLLSTGRSG